MLTLAPASAPVGLPPLPPALKRAPFRPSHPPERKCFHAASHLPYNYHMAKLKGDRIRRRRHTLGVRQEDLAKEVKMSVSTINRFERNKGDAKASVLYDIAKALKCRMEDFF